MRSFVVLACMLAFATASCPNQCSGHGRCGANDKCECYQQSGSPWGHRAGWTGADCSMRTCAVDTAFDNIGNIEDRIGTVVFGPASSRTIASDSALATLVDGIAFKASLNGGVLMSPFHAKTDAVSNTLRTISSDNTIIVKIVNTPAANTDDVVFKWKWVSDSRSGGDQYSSEITVTPRAPAASTVRTSATDVMLMDPPQADIGVTTYPTGVSIWFDNSATKVVSGDTFTFQVTRGGGTHYLESNDNSFHQQVECSGRGVCNRATGLCKCDVGYDGEACQRTSCKNGCSGHGVCQDEAHFFVDGGVNTYDLLAHSEDSYLGPYDARKQMGCKCDIGFRGPDCSLKECPSGTDPLLVESSASSGVLSAENPNYVQQDAVARDCSGRGVCDYSSGVCKCFKGYFGERCETQTNFY